MRSSRLLVPLSRASLLARTENRLTVTGSTADVETFKGDVCSGVSPRSLSFLPRGLLFGETASPPALTFQRLLPVSQPVTEPEELLTIWGSTTDALSPRLLDGRPRRKGRASAVFEFITHGHAPLPWLAAAAASQPTLRLGLMWAQPSTMAACEAVFQERHPGRYVCRGLSFGGGPVGAAHSPRCLGRHLGRLDYHGLYGLCSLHDVWRLSSRPPFLNEQLSTDRTRGSSTKRRCATVGVLGPSPNPKP